MIDVNDAREKIQDILSRDEYRVYYEDNRSFLKVWWDQFVHWLEELLVSLFPSFAPSNGFANLVLFFVIVLVIGLVGLITFLIVRRAKRNRAFHEHSPLRNVQEKDWTYEDHLQMAHENERDPDYTEATRHLFLALLLFFHEKEILVAGNGKTNLEYVVEIRQVSRHYADVFSRLAVTFDEVVYGRHILQKTEYVHFYDEIMPLFEVDLHTKEV